MAFSHVTTTGFTPPFSLTRRASVLSFAADVVGYGVILTFARFAVTRLFLRSTWLLVCRCSPNTPPTPDATQVINGLTFLQPDSGLVHTNIVNPTTAAVRVRAAWLAFQDSPTQHCRFAPFPVFATPQRGVTVACGSFPTPFDNVWRYSS